MAKGFQFKPDPEGIVRVANGEAIAPVLTAAARAAAIEVRKLGPVHRRSFFDWTSNVKAIPATKGADGKLLADVLLIIKNEREEPVRALKTDSLGRFELLSKLSNGNYSIEVKPSEEMKLSFEKISVELKGEVTPPFVISGK